MAQLAYLGEGDGRHDVAVPADVLAPTVSLHGDPSALAQLAQDARGAGLIVRGARSLRSALDGDGGVLGDIVAVECREIGGAGLAALIRLDERAARSGAQVIVLTSRAALEDVFACCETAQAHILVDPTAAERTLALGTALMRLPRSRVREMDESDRLDLLRLIEEVARLAVKIDGLARPAVTEMAGATSDRLGSPGRDFRGRDFRGHDREIARGPRTPLPDPRLVHRIIRQRRMRDRFFDSGLFADPAWDILLDLTAARAEHRRVSVTSLCIAAAVPATTALRWIAQMTGMGILERQQDDEDKRRAFIGLSDGAAEAMARYFAELGKDGAKPV